MTDNANQRIAITFDIDGNIVENSQFSSLSNEGKQSARDFAGNVISSSSATGFVTQL